MKRSLRSLCAAAAALACCSPAFAQSTVTLYGLLDAAIDLSNNGSGTTRRLESGGTYGSRWGLKGREDLGGGLGLIFQLESGFALDSGTSQQGGRLFGRHSWVGFAHPYGELTFGRQLSPQYYSFLNTDAFQLGYAGGLQALTRTNAAGTAAFVMGGYVQTGRLDNSINYASPDIGGFSTRAMVALGETTQGQSHGGSWSINGRYNAGPVDLNAGIVKSNDVDGFGDWRVWSVGGSYQLGKAKVFVGHTSDQNSSARTPTAGAPTLRFKLTNIGVRYALTPATTLIGQAYRVNDGSDARPAGRDSNVFAVGVDHELSKRTALYASAGTVANKNGSRYSLGGALFAGTPTLTDSRAKTFTVGMRHSF